MLPGALFTSSDVQARKVKLADGTAHTLYFKEAPARLFRKVYYTREGSDDEREVAMAELFAVSLCDPDGSPAVTVDEALKLKPAVQVAIMGAIVVVNGAAPDPDKPTAEADPGN